MGNFIIFACALRRVDQLDDHSVDEISVFFVRFFSLLHSLFQMKLCKLASLRSETTYTRICTNSNAIGKWFR